VLVVAHSTAMRMTIRTAIEAIDDRSFLATTRSDPQFLDVETLHGWCIRELDLEYGPRYVLEADPTTSRQQQKQILDEVLGQALTQRYSGFRTLGLSRDFIVRIDGDRETLLRDLGWEIAIRIKGRGFRRTDLRKYAESPFKSLVGRGETLVDRHFMFHVYQMYEDKFQTLGLLDTDDVVLSMANRLTSPLWERQRRVLGYDYVMVDETHLFNENERRVLPYLTRGTADYLPLVMTFDEAQSIGGRRSVDLSNSGIENAERRNLTSVHRSSPDIFALARDVVERSPLLFSEFATIEPVARMSKTELRKCRKPLLIYADGDAGVCRLAAETCRDLRDHNLQRTAIIVFDPALLELLHRVLGKHVGAFYHVKERGELLAAVPNPGVYTMLPEACGGLEFDAVVLAGIEEGRLPLPMGDLSPEGYLSMEEEAYTELYTAITRARYQLVFVCDYRRGISPTIQPSIAGELIEVSTNRDT
jgi:superfamily I DNA/RNA helicase